MGSFARPLSLLGPAGHRETVEALVDTGSTFTVVPASILERLGVRPRRRAHLRLASGQEVEWALGEVGAELNGEQATIICGFGPPEAPPLLGAHTLEAFLLTVDPVERRLVPKTGFLV